MGKKIVFLRSNPVAPDPRVEKEADVLLRAGNEVTAVAWARTDDFKKEDVIDVGGRPVKIFRTVIPAVDGGGFKENFFYLLRFQLFLLRWLIKHRKEYQIIHACDLDTGLTALFCAVLLRKKLVYDIFDYYAHAYYLTGAFGAFVEWLERRVINGADRVIICTESRSEQLIKARPKHLTVIHNSPPAVGDLLLDPSFDRDKIKIGYVGVLIRKRMTKELAEIVARRSEFQLHIGGFGEYEDYFADMSRQNSNIIFYGRLAYAETLDLEYNCDILTALYDPAVANHKYAAPNKFYEAIMLGKPLLVARGTGIDLVVEKHRIGEVLEEFTPQSLERALERLAARRSEWPDMAQRMKQLYLTDYSFEAAEERLLSLYDELG